MVSVPLALSLTATVSAASECGQMAVDKLFRADGLRFVACVGEGGEMSIMRDHEVGMGDDGAVCKFVIVGVGRNGGELE
jgi:hypothetical protein